MADALKHLISATTVLTAGDALMRTCPAFDRARFERLALHGLDTLELKARAMQVAGALEATLPADFAEAAAMIEASLAPMTAADDTSPDSDALPRPGGPGLSGWIGWPLGEFIARRGVADAAHATRALRALHALTQRFTAEFAIRPVLLAHPELVFATLQRWSTDPSAHVRRLVSEGSRPRLPWGLQLKPLIADPSPTLPLLRALQDDPSAYVRRSVANHLNDIAKDHPAIVADWLADHLPSASAERRALLKHASRTLIKRGDPRVLEAWGVGGAFRGDAALRIAPRRIAIGESVTVHATLASTARRPQTLAIDLVVHHTKADGGTSPKVFKGWQRTLPAGGTLALSKTLPFRPITTRRYYPGTHRIELQINGRAVAETAFDLRR